MDVSVSKRRSTRGRCAVMSGGRADGTGTFVLVQYDERTNETVHPLRLDEIVELAVAAYTVDSPTRQREYPLYDSCEDHARYARLTR